MHSINLITKPNAIYSHRSWTGLIKLLNWRLHWILVLSVYKNGANCGRDDGKPTGQDVFLCIREKLVKRKRNQIGVLISQMDIHRVKTEGNNEELRATMKASQESTEALINVHLEMTEPCLETIVVDHGKVRSKIETRVEEIAVETSTPEDGSGA
jgi:hypothetical protein